MITIEIDDKRLQCNAEETVLECLERNGVSIRSSCRVGTCQSCLVRALEGSPPLNAQSGLSDTLMAQGYFLACSARIEDDIRIEIGPGAGREHRVRVESIEPLNGRVVRIRCETPPALDYMPGQFMNIAGPGDALRSYSLASVPALDAHLEFHVGLMPGGIVSSWIHQDLKPGDEITVIGPQGNCFYVPRDPAQPLVLAGTGTGLAPLYGILRDALRQSHTGPITLFQGAVSPEGLYYVDEFRRLEQEYPNLAYRPCVLKNPGGEPSIEKSPIDAFIEETFPDLEGTRVFLCGDPELVKTLQRLVFLAGAEMNDILADAFLPAATASPDPQS